MGDPVRRGGARAHPAARLLGAGGVVAIVAIALAIAPAGPAAAEESCFQACFRETLTGRSLDDFTVRDGIRLCRDRCEASLKARFAPAGRPAGPEGCAETDLTAEEVMRVRAASQRPTLMLTTFVWELRNIFPDRVLRTVEVRHLTPRMNEVVHSAKTVVPPGQEGAVAIFDLGELLPQLKQTLQVTRITACAAG